MSNVWTDQPHEAEGNTVLHVALANGYAIHVQSVDIGGGIENYAVTVGHLFGSKTFINSDATTALRQAHNYITRELPA